MTTANDFPHAPIASLVNYEAEIALLAGLMARNEAYFEVAQICRAEHFADALNGRLFAAIGRIVTAGGRADYLTMRAEFDQDLGLKVAGKDYLLKVASGVVTLIDLPAYADVIRGLWLRREIAQQAQDIAVAAADFETGPDEIIAKIIGDLNRLSGEGRNTAVPNRAVAEQLVEQMMRPVAVSPTGIASLDEVMGGGLFAGKLCGLSGRKKAGKSALLGTISYNLARAGTRHLFVTLEMTPAEIEQRNAARHLDLNPMAYLRGGSRTLARLTADYAGALTGACTYEHAPGCTLDELRNMIGRAIVRRHIDGVIVDYWQLVGGKQRNETEEFHLRSVADQLAAIGRRHGKWMLIGSQLNQEGNTRGGEGLRLACDLMLALNRQPGAETAWLEMQESRYTPYQDVGSEMAPGLWLHKNGPYFSENPPAAAPAHHELVELFREDG